jgi:DNA polymerase I-like protein with 3'-5' exonuclease and polymerase domains
VNYETGVEYCCYDIEGQINGRLNIKLPSQGFFNPHNVNVEQKNLYSAGSGKRFLVLDYKHYEVSILAWLSNDFALREIVKSGDDVYSKIWCIISGEEYCTSEKRDVIKSIFLPIIYGSGINKISELTNYSIKASTFLVDAINKNFTTTFDWVKEYQEKLKTQDYVLDYFGRVLDFSEKSGRDAWSIRNAIIQAPAALVYLEKLIQLYQKMHLSMDIVASIHDAYVCRIDSQNNSVISCAKEILESPSSFTPGLILKVDASVGDKWGTLKKININKVDYDDKYY